MLRKPVEAALFDMDGLLLDTEAIYVEAMQAAAQGLGREMSLAFCHSMVGVASHECNLMIEAYYGEGFSLTEFREHFSVHRRRLMEGGIPVKPGVVELLDFLAARGGDVGRSRHGPAPSRPRGPARSLHRAGDARRRRAHQATSGCLSRGGTPARRRASALPRLRRLQHRPRGSARRR